MNPMMKRGLVYITILTILLCLIVPTVSAESEITVQISKYFTVEYQFTETDKVSYWMLINSQELGMALNIPNSDPIPVYQFKNAVDTCVFYETKFNENLVLLATGGLSPAGLVTTIPTLIDSWDKAKQAAEEADYYFEQIYNTHYFS